MLYQLLNEDWDVDLIGPMWSRYGESLWEPLQQETLNIRSFHCDRLEDFVPKAEVMAAAKTYDLVYVCKPRLPALYLGALIKQSSDCPMLLDVDDFELSFFKNHEYAELDDLQDNLTQALVEPYEELATRYAQSLVTEADAVTVSNVALRDRFGGHIVRHARDESTFQVSDDARNAARARLGIEDDEFALVFVGTPRPHKGVGEVVRALHEINDQKIVFHIVGTLTDQQLRDQLSQYTQARVVLHPNCAFQELPVLLAAADLVPLIQDVTHPISQHQIPAKISDALSLGIPVLATNTPPLRDLIAQGAITATDIEGLTDAIRRCRDNTQSRSILNAQLRRTFLSELGTSVNRTRLNLAVDEAELACSPLSDKMQQLLNTFRAQYKASQLPPDQAQNQTVTHLSHRFGHRVSRRIPSFLGGKADQYDIAFFWKQNDSGIYGRRSDMLAKHLAASGRVNRIVHFDAPVSASTLDQHFSSTEKQARGQQQHILKNLFDRQLGLHDDSITNHRTFVYSPSQNRGQFVDQPIAKQAAYVRYVREQLEAAGMRPERTYAWFCPVIWDAMELIDKVGFAGVVSDLIDDQRAWNANKNYNTRLDKNYQQTLSHSDLVFTNCDALADGMSGYAEKIHVVPNGAERFLQQAVRDKPAALAALDGPIVGYVGNLRDRVDWLLLQKTVSDMPEVNFVFLGPSGDNPNADSLAMHANVHMLGVVPYDEVPGWLMHFDVGIVPHVNNRLTERMNPLKVYNYFAAGLPIVSTEVSNLGALGDALTVAESTDEFIAAVRVAIDNRPDTSIPSWQATMDSIAWDTRVNDILSEMDKKFLSQFLRSA